MLTSALITLYSVTSVNCFSLIRYYSCKLISTPCPPPPPTPHPPTHPPKNKKTQKKCVFLFFLLQARGGPSREQGDGAIEIPDPDDYEVHPLFCYYLPTPEGVNRCAINDSRFEVSHVLLSVMISDCEALEINGVIFFFFFFFFLGKELMRIRLYQNKNVQYSLILRFLSFLVVKSFVKISSISWRLSNK